MSEATLLHQVTLEIVTGERKGHAIALAASRLIVGRETDCGLRLQDTLCSRHHAVFLCDAFAMRVRDLGSLNGTYVNGVRIRSEVMLKAGDAVRVGGTTLMVRIRPVAPVPKEETAMEHRGETRILF